MSPGKEEGHSEIRRDPPNEGSWAEVTLIAYFWEMLGSAENN